MKTIKRSPIFYDLNKEQKKWLKSNCCPICGLPKNKWKRRTDWRCCSKDCTHEFSKITYVWQWFKEKAFKRDKYTCIKCGKKPKRREMHSRKDKEGNWDYYWKEVDGNNSSELIADHIVPIAIGGKEYDLNNIQTLCIECNKEKTKEDMKKIANRRN